MEEKEGTLEEIDFKDLFVIRAISPESEECFITIGDYKASPKTYSNHEEAEKAIENKDWNLIATAIVVQVKHAIKLSKEEEK
jgi:hypothetical protein